MSGYAVSASGDSITCHRCGLTSYSSEDVAHRYCGMCHIFHDDPSQPLSLWTVYKHPSDYPGMFVARLFVVASGASRATDRTITAKSLDDLRVRLPRGLVRLAPQPGDDPCIAEVWI